MKQSLPVLYKTHRFLNGGVVISPAENQVTNSNSNNSLQQDRNSLVFIFNEFHVFIRKLFVSEINSDLNIMLGNRKSILPVTNCWSAAEQHHG